MKRVLVTGVNGFVGHHLVRELHSRGLTVHGTGHGSIPMSDDVAPLLASYTLCDLTKPEEVAELPLADSDAVINLAGLAKVGDSFAKPELYQRINVDVLRVLADHLVALGSHARIVAVSTGGVYTPGQPMPLTEDSETVTEGTGSPYVLSKLAMEEAAHTYEGKLDIVVVRPFNHIGPGQAPGFLVPDLYQKLTEAGEGGSIMVGNLATKRDYTDVRDIVKAYADLATLDDLQADTFNICSGTSHAGQEVLDLIMAELHLTGKVTVEVDQSLIRPTDPPDSYGSYDRLKQAIGWQPSIPLEQTIRDFIAAQQ